MTNWTGIRWMMGGTGLALAAIATVSLTANTVSADPNDNELVIEGQKIPTQAKAPEGSPFDELYSGWRYRSPETQALQMDDFENPGHSSTTSTTAAPSAWAPRSGSGSRTICSA